MSGERVPQLPQVPTAKELGFAEVEAYTWQGLVAPAATPKDIQLKLGTDLLKAMNDPAVRQKLFDAGWEARPTDAAEHEPLRAVGAQEVAGADRLARDPNRLNPERHPHADRPPHQRQAVAGRDYFQTVNPATQEVLAEVASGGEAEVNAAVAAAKEAFPKWAGLPAPERAKLIRKLGDLIAKNVPEIAQTETNDCGQVIAQTGKQLVPRAADNFYYFAEMCTRVDGHTYPTPTHLNYTLFHPVGVCALISPWNVPFMTATWKVAPCLAFGNTAVLKMSELSPLTAARLGELALEAGIPAGVLNLVHGYGKGSRRAAGGAPRRARDLVHRIDRHRQPHREERGPEEVQHGAGRQEPVRDLRRRRPRPRARCADLHDLQQQRRALHGRLAHPGAAVDLCRLRGQSSPSGRSASRSATRSTRRPSSGR